MSNPNAADALQWAIDKADNEQQRDTRSQVERNYLHHLEQLKKACEGKSYRAFKQPT